MSHIKAPDDVFIKKEQYDSLSDGEADDETDVPQKFRSRREERFYLGRDSYRQSLRMFREPDL